MSSGGSTGLPATPAPTPFAQGGSLGIRPEDLVAGISRLSVIEEAREVGENRIMRSGSPNQLDQWGNV